MHENIQEFTNFTEDQIEELVTGTTWLLKHCKLLTWFHKRPKKQFKLVEETLQDKLDSRLKSELKRKGKFYEAWENMSDIKRKAQIQVHKLVRRILTTKDIVHRESRRKSGFKSSNIKKCQKMNLWAYFVSLLYLIKRCQADLFIFCFSLNKVISLHFKIFFSLFLAHCFCVYGTLCVRVKKKLLQI